MKWHHLILILIFLTGCANDQAEKEAFIQAEVERRLSDYEESKMEACRDKIMEKVIEAADSILLRRAYFDIPDTLDVPGKRSRPLQPKIPFPEFKRPAPPDTSETQ